MKQLVSVKVASAVIAGLGLTTGLVGVVGASAGTLSNTGNDSENYVTSEDNTEKATANTTDAVVTNNNPQDAVSGDVTTADNDDASGDATSGTAANDSQHTVMGTVDYTGVSGAAVAAPAPNTASIDGTGDDSVNTVDSTSNHSTAVAQATNVNVQNNNAQSARSGNVSSTGNENAGKATSGNATNTSTTSTTFNVKY